MTIMHLEDVAADLGITPHSLACYLSQNRHAGAPRPVRRGYYHLEEIRAFRADRKRGGIEKRREWMLRHKPNSKARYRVDENDQAMTQGAHFQPTPTAEVPVHLPNGANASAVAESLHLVEQLALAVSESSLGSTPAAPVPNETSSGSAIGSLVDGTTDIANSFADPSLSCPDEATTQSVGSDETESTGASRQTDTSEGELGDTSEPPEHRTGALSRIASVIQRNPIKYSSSDVPAPPQVGSTPASPLVDGLMVAGGIAGLTALGYGLTKTAMKLGRANREVEAVRRKLANLTGEPPKPLTLKERFKIAVATLAGKDVPAQTTKEFTHFKRELQKRQRATRKTIRRRKKTHGGLSVAAPSQPQSPTILNPPAAPSRSFTFPAPTDDIVVPNRESPPTPPSVLI